MRTSILITLLVIPLVLLGCEGLNGQPPVQTATADVMLSPPSAPLYYTPGTGADDIEALGAVSAALGEAEQLRGPAPPLLAEDISTYRALLDRHRDQPYYALLEQTLAFQLLNAVPDLGREGRSLTEDEAANVAFAARLLVQNGSPNAALMLSTLHALEGHWSEAEVADAASLAAAAGARQLEAPCRACTRNEAAANQQEANRAAVAALAQMGS